MKKLFQKYKLRIIFICVSVVSVIGAWIVGYYTTLRYQETITGTYHTVVSGINQRIDTFQTDVAGEISRLGEESSTAESEPSDDSSGAVSVIAEVSGKNEASKNETSRISAESETSENSAPSAESETSEDAAPPAESEAAENSAPFAESETSENSAPSAESEMAEVSVPSAESNTAEQNSAP